jgi:RNA polymerase sigma-70 factor (ECF subfamily)
MNAGGMRSTDAGSGGKDAGSGGSGGSGGSSGAVGAANAGWRVTHRRHANGKLVTSTCTESSSTIDFRVVYEHWFQEVSRWIRAMGGPEADREDLVQDVFVVVHRRLPDFDGNNLPGWLYQIARHRVRDFRRLSWVKHLLLGGVPLSENLATEGASPSETLEGQQKRAMLERLFEKLTESERATLVLFEIEGYSGEEIAQLQGVPLNTVWSRIYKSRKKLKGWLAKSRET